MAVLFKHSVPYPHPSLPNKKLKCAIMYGPRWRPLLWALALLAFRYVNTAPIDAKCGFKSVETTLGLAGLDFLVQRSQNTLFCSRYRCLRALELRAARNSVKRPILKWCKHGMVVATLSEYGYIKDLSVDMDVQVTPGPISATPELQNNLQQANRDILNDPQAPQAENTWCMRQLVYIENCMGKSQIVKKLCK